MSAWAEVNESRVREGERWCVTLDVARSYGVPRELFVFRLDSQSYSHPCVADDVDRWPTTPGDAEAQGVGFYRQSSVSRDFATPREMSEFVTFIRGRLQAVVISWPGETDYETPGTSTYVLGADS